MGVCVRVADPRPLSTHPAAPATALVCVSEEHEQVEVLPPRPAGQGLRQQVDGGMDTRNLQGVRPTRASSGGMATQKRDSAGPQPRARQPGRQRLTVPEWSKDLTLATLCCTVE